MDCSPQGSSVHGIFQARVLEWGATSFSRGSSQPSLGFTSPALSLVPTSSLRPLTLAPLCTGGVEGQAGLFCFSSSGLSTGEEQSLYSLGPHGVPGAELSAFTCLLT